MEWIGWLLAAGLGVALYSTTQQDNKSQRALALMQVEIAKLASLWAYEVQARRSLQDEYDRPSESIKSECVRRFDSAEEPLSLIRYSDFDSASQSLLDSRHAILHTGVLQADPALWVRQYMSLALIFVSKDIQG